MNARPEPRVEGLALPLTLFVSDHPCLKGYRHNPDSSVTKIEPKGSGSGRYCSTTVPSLRELPGYFEALAAHDSWVCYAAGPAQQGLYASEDNLKGGMAAPGSIARTDQFFPRLETGFGIFPIDIDFPKVQVPFPLPARAEECDRLLSTLVPELAAVERFWRPSASAFLYYPDGSEYRGAKGWRCLFAITQPHRARELGELIVKRFKEAGYKWFEPDKNGKPKEKCLIDGSMWNGGAHPDFVFGPTLSGGLYKQDPPPFWAGELPYFDMAAMQKTEAVVLSLPQAALPVEEQVPALRKIREALRYVPCKICDDTETWLGFGGAIFRATGGSEAGFAVWDEWSATSDRYTDGICRERWKATDVGKPLPRAMSLASIYFHARQGGWVEAKTAPEATGKPSRVLTWQLASEVKIEPIEWVWEPYFPAQALSIVFGVPGAGKSTLMCRLIAHISKGEAWPDGKPCGQGEVLVVNGEDARNVVLAPRLKAAGADLDRVVLIDTVVSEGEERDGLDLSKDLAGLEVLLDSHPDTKLLVLDPINAFLGRVDAHKDVDIRRVLSPLAELADRRRIAIVMLCHNRKSTEGSPLDMIMGSRGYGGAARSVIFVSKKPAEDDGLFTPVKTQYGPLGTGLTFRIMGHTLPLYNEHGALKGAAKTSYAMWTGESGMTADDVVQAMREAQQGRGRPDVERQETRRILEDILRNGPVAVSEVKKHVAEAGVSWRTARRAQADMGIEIRRKNDASHWQLPKNYICETLPEAGSDMA